MLTSHRSLLKVLSFLPDGLIKSLSGVATLAGNAETRFPQVFLIVALFRRLKAAYSSGFLFHHHFMASPSCFLSTLWLLRWRCFHLLCPCGERLWFPLRLIATVSFLKYGHVTTAAAANMAEHYQFRGFQHNREQSSQMSSSGSRHQSVLKSDIHSRAQCLGACFSTTRCTSKWAYFLFLEMDPLVCMCSVCVQVPMKAGRGSHIPWNSRYRQLGAAQSAYWLLSLGPWQKQGAFLAL